MPNANEQYAEQHFDKNGLLHRVGGPARVYLDGSAEWYIHGNPHREDGPAVDMKNGHREWYVNGVCHRENGPAVIRANGTQEWRRNGVLERDDGPAVIYSDGRITWWINGVNVDIIDVLASTDTGVLFMTLVDSMPRSMRPALVQYVNRVMHDSRDN